MMLTENEAFRLVDQRFPHIGQRLVASWGQPGFVAYIDGLVNQAADGMRQGFPREIVLALAALKQEHDREFPQQVGVPQHECHPEKLVDSAELNEVNQRFPHIGRQLLALWGGRDFSVYVNQLMTDTRGGTRQGFPSEVALALFKLIQEHDRAFPEHAIEVQDIWSLNNGG
jgi:hypothetical protein